MTLDYANGYSPVLLGFTAAFVFIIGLVGTFGNILAAMALLHDPKLRQRPATAFMINLPACLILVCVIGMPMFGAACLQLIHYGELSVSQSCIITVHLIVVILSEVHIHTICALAFNRLVAVVWPSWYKRLMRPKIVTIYILSLWVYSILLWVPLAFGMFEGLEYKPEEMIVSMKTKSRGKRGFHVFLTYLLPILITSICYLIMYIKVRRIREVTRARPVSIVNVNESNVIRQWDDHVTRTIFVIYAILITCSFPHLIIHIIHLYEKSKATWLMLHVVFWLQFCLDPLVYVFCSRQYRRATLQCLGAIFPSLKVFQVEDYPRSEARSDVKGTRLISSPASCNKLLRPPPQKIEFSSDVHRDLLDPKNITNIS